MRSKIFYFLLAFILLAASACASTSSFVPVSPPSTQPVPSQTILATPADAKIAFEKNYYLVFDNSDSMGDPPPKKATSTPVSGTKAPTFDTKIDGAKWALSEFVTKWVPSDVNVGLYVLNVNSGKNELVALGQNNRQEIISKIKAISQMGNTPLNRSLRDATDALIKQRNRQLGYGEYYIVVITDGAANDTGGSGAETGVAYASKAEIPIITIGFGIQNHPLRNKSLSYREATDSNELLQALKEVQGETENFDK
jgi:Ca-activated chloride channel homolog